MRYPELVTRVKTVTGVMLKWEERERTGPIRDYSGKLVFTDRPPKGTLLRKGEVFVPYDLLNEIVENDGWGGPIYIGHFEKMALVHNGLLNEYDELPSDKLKSWVNSKTFSARYTAERDRVSKLMKRRKDTV